MSRCVRVRPALDLPAWRGQVVPDRAWWGESACSGGHRPGPSRDLGPAGAELAPPERLVTVCRAYRRERWGHRVAVEVSFEPSVAW